mgnify:CR=1 FL=1
MQNITTLEDPFFIETKYRVENNCIGKGSYGVVYAGTNIRSKDRLAIKFS